MRRQVEAETEETERPKPVDDFDMFGDDSE